MPEIEDASLKDDVAELLAETPEKPENPEPEPDPPAKKGPEPKAEKEPEPEPEPKKRDLPEWSKPLTRAQQEIASLKETNKALGSKLDKLLAHVGIEPDAAPAEIKEQVQQLDPETKTKIVELERKVEFGHIRQEHPGSNPDKAWDKAWDDALETYDIDKDAETLPEGITAKALEKLADKNFKAWRDGLGKKEPAPAPPKGPQRKVPPKTAGGAGVPLRPASHVPDTTHRLDEREDFKRDLEVLMGPAD